MHDRHDEWQYPAFHLGAVAERINIRMVGLQRAVYRYATIYRNAGCLRHSRAGPQPDGGKHEVCLNNVAIGERQAKTFMNPLDALSSSRPDEKSRRLLPVCVAERRLRAEATACPEAGD